MKGKAETSRSSPRVLTVQMLFTVLAWTVLLSLLSWLLVAVGWYLLALLWRRVLLIPRSVALTVRALGLVLLWALIIFIGQLGWTKFNFARYFKRNRRKLELLENGAPLPSWAEIRLAPPRPPITTGSEDLPVLSKYRRKTSPTPSKCSPAQLLSSAALPSLHGGLIGVISVLRLGINGPEVPHFMRQVAACSLASLLSMFGHDRLERRLASHFHLNTGAFFWLTFTTSMATWWCGEARL